MRACAVLVGLAVMLALPVAGLCDEQAVAKQVVVSADLSVEEVALGVWLHTSWDEVEGFGRVPANGLVVVGNGEAALIDTPWNNALTGELFDWVVKNLGCPITTVVATHSHGDNLGGLNEAHSRGAASWALDRTLELARSAGRPVPQHGFSDRKVLSVGGRTLELRYLGGGHTVDNIVVWIGDQKVLFGGCLVKAAGAKTLGYTKEADLAAWPQTVTALRSAYPDARLIVPGHGSPGGYELLDRTLELLTRGTAARGGLAGSEE